MVFSRASWFGVGSQCPLAFALLDMGKVFSILAAVHNSAEVLILFLFFNSGKLASWMIPGALIHWSLIVATCMIFPWPFDAVWFKFQGLIYDFALVIYFTNLASSTRTTQAEGYIPLTTEIDEVSSSTLVDSNLKKGEAFGVSDIQASKWTRVIYPIIASAVHGFGNIPPTIFPNSPLCLIIFLFSYGITYPLYAYFLYLNIKAENSGISNSGLTWPKYSLGKHVATIFFSVVGSITVIGVAMANMNSLNSVIKIFVQNKFAYHQHPVSLILSVKEIYAQRNE
ncbi:hypothetical protein HK096_008835, partial [Nowakowskiella sp. JEL0078]